ncbi:DUF1345 domain-containing protein [uncultured Leifsonia sp.]|uniref:DUF1345 domain-containing protein n=1 Tax=uncultured Leifsonia sp. TaxID=340359 RepID=UPI0025EE6542|nr:DUF1345 domain-containing protein [uncultured Leifsonia sp.]
MTNELKRGRGHTRVKMYIALAVGIVVAVATSFVDAVHHAVIAGWAAACLVYIVWIWTSVWRMDSPTTRDHATLEDPGRRTADLVLLIAALASVVAVVWVLVDARNLKGAAQLGVALLAVVSVALSWLLVHTIYMLRYARIYYRNDGGVDFNQDEPPQYSDFAYLSLTLGMTFQVSDTNISSSYLRRAILRHTLLSYLFGTVIVAATVNLVAGLT